MENLVSHLQSTNTSICAVEGNRWRIDWLLGLKDQFTSILNLGCNVGYETIGLLWFLNAEKAIGIDINAEAIQQANDIVEALDVDLVELKRAMDYPIHIPTDLRHRVVSILEGYGQHALPTYQVSDITQEVDLPSASYDLAYCHKVLYHLACGAVEDPGRSVVFDGIWQVSNLLEVGGLFVAIEPLTCTPEDPTLLDLADMFSAAGLKEARGSHAFPEIEGRRIYCYAKV